MAGGARGERGGDGRGGKVVARDVFGVYIGCPAAMGRGVGSRTEEYEYVMCRTGLIFAVFSFDGVRMDLPCREKYSSVPIVAEMCEICGILCTCRQFCLDVGLC